MLIGNRYKIESDGLNVTLLKKRIARIGDHKGEEYWTAEGYYGTVANALKALVDMGVKETQLKDFKTIVKKQGELYKLIEGV
ncbi:hypothetical protein LCGC14_0922570 [marine sediment metagenome]|uniref:Uncharacterized protein n=1 Tax=marine sediment metagenome TaxID=412755 RepID=A0A0F9PB03_9ZZZZ